MLWVVTTIIITYSNIFRRVAFGCVFMKREIWFSQEAVSRIMFPSVSFCYDVDEREKMDS